MPSYDVRNKETGEEKEIHLKISELDAWKSSNPAWEIFYPEGTRLFGTRVDQGFNTKDLHKKHGGFQEVIQKVHERTAGSQLDNTSNYIK